MEQSVYDAAGGAAGLSALVHAWHARCLADPVVNHAFTHGPLHPQHSERLAAYLGEALGGPPAYTATMGDETHAVRMHSGNGEDAEINARGVACFVVALADVGLTEPRLVDLLAAYFATATAAMSAYPRSPDDVPSGLPLPHWGWDGPVSD